jgi:hypothetical protein
VSGYAVGVVERSLSVASKMGDTEQRVLLGIGSAAAASAIFAPLAFKWKGVLTGLAAGLILTGVYSHSPVKKLLGM